ncbi:hypothetical protein Y032_0206g1975 [Ancylostoma ceylanicum]|uniref:Bromodomain associated domain-containing protein n=1 Tax=Ancylostoma ceylanicum TaxID=53326 RepID=A0A016SM59_9BILA|nr:hypothetical protein Y032_0206g1975 [Ancylostoma ceylanicum]
MDVLHEYINIQIRCATARCLAQLGFTQTSSVCFDAMSDIMELYLKKFASCVQYYMEQRGETTPCVMDVARAFDYMRVSRHELFEYMRQVRPMEPILPVPMFPVPPDKTTCTTNIYFPNKDIATDVDEKTSEASEETQLMKPFPCFSETTAYSAGLIREPLAEITSHAQQKSKIKLLADSQSPRHANSSGMHRMFWNYL